MKRLGFSVVGLWLIAVVPGYADVDGRTIALNCMTCHADQPDVAETGIPALRRLSEQQLQQALLDFKYDRRSATLMPRIAKGYSDTELAEVAAYISRH